MEDIGSQKPKIKILGENTKFEEIKTNTNQSEKIDLGSKQEKASETTTLNFMDSNFNREFVGKKTKLAEENNQEVKDDAFKGKTTEQVRSEIKSKEDNQEDWTPQDFEMIAGFIITMIDTVIASGLRWWSKDTSDAAYSISKDKQQKLIKQLAMILIKYQAKFRVEIIFLLSIIMFYAIPFMKAKERRKTVKEEETKLAEIEALRNADTQNQVFEQEKKTDTVSMNEEVITPQVITETSGVEKRTSSIPRRRPGRQPK